MTATQRDVTIPALASRAAGLEGWSSLWFRTDDMSHVSRRTRSRSVRPAPGRVKGAPASLRDGPPATPDPTTPAGLLMLRCGFGDSVWAEEATSGTKRSIPSSQPRIGANE
jgi:hypothetical protein